MLGMSLPADAPGMSGALNGSKRVTSVHLRRGERCQVLEVAEAERYEPHVSVIPSLFSFDEVSAGSTDGMKGIPKLTSLTKHNVGEFISKRCAGLSQSKTRLHQLHAVLRC